MLVVGNQAKVLRRLRGLWEVPLTMDVCQELPTYPTRTFEIVSYSRNADFWQVAGIATVHSKNSGRITNVQQILNTLNSCYLSQPIKVMGSFDTAPLPLRID